MTLAIAVIMFIVAAISGGLSKSYYTKAYSPKGYLGGDLRETYRSRSDMAFILCIASVFLSLMLFGAWKHD